MKIAHYSQTPAQPAEVPGVGIRGVINKNDGAPHCAMRVIEVQPGRNTPYHTHGFEHEVYILEGKGVVRAPDGDQPVSPGMVVYVPADEEHGFFNQGDDILRFICVIPHQG